MRKASTRDKRIEHKETEGTEDFIELCFLRSLLFHVVFADARR
jgi:hypothetical protein